ncbi:MAG: ribosome maturation factor RimM [Gemmatimonadetes bacterium]|nr:ribosome maturation factor RimM [Gemmatimonadota bacterium]
MARAAPDFLAVGHLTRAHGILGEFFVASLTDHPESSFAPGVVLRLGDALGLAPDPDLPPLCVESARAFKGGLIVAFQGVETRSEAEALRGRYLLRPVAELEPPAEGEYWQHELEGLEVFTVQGRRLGTVRALYELAPSDLLEVAGEGKQYLIPFREEIVVEVDVEGGRMVIDPPDGLLDL